MEVSRGHLASAALSLPGPRARARKLPQYGHGRCRRTNPGRCTFYGGITSAAFTGRRGRGYRRTWTVCTSTRMRFPGPLNCPRAARPLSRNGLSGMGSYGRSGDRCGIGGGLQEEWWPTTGDGYQRGAVGFASPGGIRAWLRRRRGYAFWAYPASVGGASLQRPRPVRRRDQGRRER